MEKNLPAVQETKEMWVPSLGQEDALEMGMATHSSILAWRVAWTEEPGRIQSMGLPRVGHNLADEHTHTTSSLSVILLMDIWVASAILAIVNSAEIGRAHV